MMSQAKDFGLNLFISGFPNKSYGNGFKHKLEVQFVVFSLLYSHSLSLCFLSFSQFFPINLYLSAFPLLIQSLFSGVLIIVVSPIFMDFHFCQKPKKPLCLLRILLKLVLDAKYCLVAGSTKALTTLATNFSLIISSSISHHFISRQWAEHLGFSRMIISKSQYMYCRAGLTLTGFEVHFHLIGWLWLLRPILGFS